MEEINKLKELQIVIDDAISEIKNRENKKPRTEKDIKEYNRNYYNLVRKYNSNLKLYHKEYYLNKQKLQMPNIIVKISEDKNDLIVEI